MAKNACIWTPGVNKDLSGEPSALHSDLVEYTGDRQLANAVYAAVKAGGLDNSNLELDSNGEPTLESVNKQIPLRGMVNKTSLSVEKKELGAVDKKGNLIAYDSLEEVLSIIKDFNEQNPDLVAFPTEQDKKFFINVEYKNDSNYIKPQEAAFNSELNKSLLGILRSLGFTAINDDSVVGIFDPLNAMETANGLKTIIRVAKGKVGEEAFPEEFSHAMIEGLQDHPLVIRILNSLNNDEVLMQVLGEDYDKYAEVYSENGRVDKLRMQKEAAGKLLQKQITDGELIDTPAPKTLFERLWNFIKELLGKANEADIDRAINEANNNTAQLASRIMDESILPYFNKTKVISADALYKLEEETNLAKKIAEEGLKTASKRLKIVQARSKNSEYKPADIRSLKNIQDLIEKKKYAASSLAFLDDTLKQLTSVSRKLDLLDKEIDSSDVAKLRRLASVLREVKEFADGYTDVVNTMRRLPSLLKQGKVELTEDDATSIASKANEVSLLINDLKGNYGELRYRVVYEFLKTYWGEDKIWDIGKNKGKQLTLANILDLADKDINGLDRWISSMSDASDPFLSLIDKSVKVARANRDVKLEEILADIRGIHHKLIESGETTEFMYERDENGKLTGRIISNIDFVKFNKDRDAYIKSLKDKGLKPWEVKAKLESWDNKHTVKVRITRDNTNGGIKMERAIGEDDDSEVRRVEILPKGLKKGDPYYVDRLSKLNGPQREYYDTIMLTKVILDKNLPNRYTNLFNAIQVRNDLIEGISQSDSPTAAVKMILGNMTDNFLRRTDDTEFGEQVEGDESTEKAKGLTLDLSRGKVKNVTLDFSGNPIRKLPIYYTKPLEDMSRLSTDFTGAMLAYAGMSIDYGEMSKIVDILELARDLAHDRDINQFSGDQKIVESFKVLHKEFSGVYTKKGGRIAERLDDYLDTVVYGRKKKDEGTISFLGKEIDVAKSLDTFKSYSGAVGLGLNLFSGMSNVTVGKMQIFIDAVSGEYFGVKNSIVGKKNYYALLKDYLGEVNSTNKSNKLALLIDKYDALEEFYEGLRAQGKFKGPISRLMQNTGIYILNNLGEHYLHSRTMLAMLDREKVKLNGKEISLFDAWKVRSLKDDNGNPISSELVLQNGTTDLEGNLLFTEEYAEELDSLNKINPSDMTSNQKARLEELNAIKKRTNDFNVRMKLRIGKVNQALNGAFNEADKGSIHRYALGRMAMQFRQWMPAHYYRRFASAYYDAQLEQFREGYYRTLGRFTLNLLKDMREAKFQVLTRWHGLSSTEKANFVRAATELSIFVLLSTLCGMIGHWKDKKGNWAERMILYNLKRMQLETGASIPWSTIISNMWTILQSPAAAMKVFENVTKLLEFQNMFNELQSGRYKGWSEYERDLTLVLPLYGKIRNVFDISEENYMFNIFDK